MDTQPKSQPENGVILPSITEHSEGFDDDIQLEAESIASALEGCKDGSASDHNDGADLEKELTQTNRSGHEHMTRIVTAVDWAGHDDPENPLTWPLWRRAYYVGATGFLAFAVIIGSSIITPSFSQIALQFGVSRTVAVLPLTLFVLGLAFGPVLGAPVSETFGRSVVYKASPPVFMLFTLGAGFSQSFGSLLVCRLLAGLAGAPVLAVGAGTNADLFSQQHRAVSSAIFSMVPFLGPTLGPVIGGFVAQFKGWRWTQWCMIFIGIAAYAFILPMRETYKKVILQRRAKKHGVPGPPTFHVTGLAYFKLLITITLARPIHMLITEPIVLLLSLYNAFTFAVLFTLFGAYPFAFEGIYGFNTWQYGLTFLGVGIGGVLAVVTSIIVARIIYFPQYQRAMKEGKAAVAPEQRLYAAMAGAFGVPIGLFWWGWTARRSVHWISPVLAGIPFAWGNLCIFVCTATYLIDVYGPLNGASAMAANGILRYTFGAVFPLFTLQMYEALGIPWATSLLGFVAIVMMPIPFVFYKFGPRIRANSHYETLKI